MLPDGIPTKWFKPQSVYDMLGSMVIRRDRIPVIEQVSNESIPFLNPPGTTPGNPTNTHGDLPIEVIHVDPNLPAGTGNGTAENPFGSLQQALVANNQRIDIIDIEPRTDGTGTNLMTNGVFNLYNYQHVWGTTIAHTIDTTAGMITIAPQTPGLALPLVSNGVNTANSTVFSLASVNEISGLHISGANSSGTAFGNGIANLNGPIVDFNINNNEFTTYQNAVFLQNAFGDGSSLHLSSNLIYNNTATGTTNVSQNGFEIINTEPGTLDVTIKGNTSTNNAGDGFLVEAASVGTVITAAFTNNTASQNGGSGIHVEATGGVVNVDSFTGNTVTSNAGNGVWIDAQEGAGGGTINVTNFQGNTIAGNGTAPFGPIGSDPDGLLISAQGPSAVINAAIGVLNGLPNVISNNGATGIGGAGIHVFVNSGGVINGSIVNNTINNNVSFGINVDALNGTIGTIGASPTMAGAVPFVINSNMISGNGDAGIFVRLQNEQRGWRPDHSATQSSMRSTAHQIAAWRGRHGHASASAPKGRHSCGMPTSKTTSSALARNGSAGANIGNGIEFETDSNSRLPTRPLSGPVVGQNHQQLDRVQRRRRHQFQRNGDSVVNDVRDSRQHVPLQRRERYRPDHERRRDRHQQWATPPLAIELRSHLATISATTAFNGAVLSSTGDADLPSCSEAPPRLATSSTTTDWMA